MKKGCCFFLENSSETFLGDFQTLFSIRYVSCVSDPRGSCVHNRSHKSMNNAIEIL